MLPGHVRALAFALHPPDGRRRRGARGRTEALRAPRGGADAMNALINFLLTHIARKQGAIRRWRGLAESPRVPRRPAAAGETLASIVILSWKRPDNVRRILDRYTRYQRVGEI